MILVFKRASIQDYSADGSTLECNMLEGTIAIDGGTRSGAGAIGFVKQGSMTLTGSITETPQITRLSFYL